MKQLDPKTAATFTVPSHINYARRKTLDKYLRKQCPAQYVGMKGSTLYFTFRTSAERDEFLLSLEAMVRKHGNQVERV